jgi:hypothetical protein
VSQRSLRPAELFTDFYRRKNQADPPPEMLALFDTVLEEVHSAEEVTAATPAVAGLVRS